MSLGDYLQSAFAFGFVIALIALAALAARRFGLGHAPRREGQRRLTISEAAPLDARYKLVLVRRDDVEHLVVLGPNGAMLVESGIAGGPEGARRPVGAALRPVSTFSAAMAGGPR